MTLLQPPSFLQARTDHTAQQDRLNMAGIFRRDGVSGYAVALGVNLVRAQGSPNMSVIVAREGFRIAGSENTHQGFYYGYNDGDVTVTLAAAHGSLTRIDIIVAYIQDAAYSGASNQLVIGKVDGTPGSGVAPAGPANSLVLATISVAPNATTITNANITIVARKVAANGGLLPVANVTERNAGSGEFDAVLRQDTNNVEVKINGQWRIVGGGGPFTYTPTWTSSNTAPSLGNGSISGWYSQEGNRVDFGMEIVFGSTTSGGTGQWRFGLPSGLAVARRATCIGRIYLPTYGSFQSIGQLSTTEPTVIVPHGPVSNTDQKIDVLRSSAHPAASGTSIPVVPGSFGYTDTAFIQYSGSYFVA